MKILNYIFVILFLSYSIDCSAQLKEINVQMFGDSLVYIFQKSLYIDTLKSDSENDIVDYIHTIDNADMQQLSSALVQFNKNLNLDNWMYYQLIRKTAEQIAPKKKNYILYTIYKWYLLTRSGYDAILTYHNGKVLFYVNSKDSIYNIPVRIEDNQQYVCLNYHDYENINFKEEIFNRIPIRTPNSTQSFTYKVNMVPAKKDETAEKVLQFKYNNTEYQFKIKLNQDVAAYFRNYPTMDYEKHFNIPLSRETYNSLIPSLTKHVKGLSTKSGVDFLMHFTRYAFLFKSDKENFGKEKRLSPEMTLLSESSDCEDRVSLFYYLVKEIYDLPMIIMVYPKHVSIAVHFDRNFGKTVEYNGKKFSICDPTPQGLDLNIGESLPTLKHEPYQVAFVYEPKYNKN
ncbi:MAG: hypothetical protein ACK4V4_09405 [Sphingobacteriales bacterium]